MSAMRTLMYPTSEIWFMFVVVALLLFGIFVALCVACFRLRQARDQTKTVNKNLGLINDALASQVTPTLAESGTEIQSETEPEVKNREDQVAGHLDPRTQDNVQSPYERFAEKKKAEASDHNSVQSPMDRRAERYRKAHMKQK